jgi:hypothetical protein
VENLLCPPWEDDGQQWRLVWVGRLGASSASMAAGSGAPLDKPRAPAWAAVFGETPGMVDLAWAAASFTQWLGFQSLLIKIHRRTDTIYRAFYTEL